MSEEKKDMHLKTIDFSEGKFEANGKTYFIESELSIKRAVFVDAAKFQLETGLSIGSQMEDWRQVYDLANQQRFADIAVVAYNNQRGFKNFFEMHDPVLKICACYINTEDEDRREINDDIVTRKVFDWAEEGIAKSSFFALVLALLTEETRSYANSAQTILELVKEFNEMKSEKVKNLITSN